jgi:hypothetical protein
MDQAWVDQVLEKLGQRYKKGAIVDDAVEILYRAGKAEFRPSRFTIGLGQSGREMELVVDVRVPKGAESKEADALIAAFESLSATPRGFSRVGETSATMTTESGEAHGSARTLKYRHGALEAADAAKQIRAIVESIDIPITVGIHEPEHLVAREPPPPSAKPAKRATEPLDHWEYDLEHGLLKKLTVIIDPNVRTLRVVERKLLAKRDLSETIKLAHVAKFTIRRSDGAATLVAIKRDGQEVTLASGPATEDFIATAGRMAKKVMIPLE